MGPGLAMCPAAVDLCPPARPEVRAEGCGLS
jgi:hypothetical protein